MNIIETHNVPLGIERQRLSEYVLGKFVTYPTNSGIKKAIKKQLVCINGKIGKTADFICGGELIEILKSEEQKPSPIIEIPIEVLFEDDYLAVVNKPAGIEVSGNKKWTLENALSPHISVSTQADGLAKAQPVHRLDYPTSGVLIVAKTASMVIALSAMFENKQIQKTYLAVTIGAMDTKFGEVNEAIDDKESHSSFEVLDSVVSPRFSYLNLVKLNPHTGRRHQLRKHMFSLGKPILGDLLYAIDGLALKGKGLYLHASKVEFCHPITMKPINVLAPIPKKYLKLFPNQF